LSNFSNFVLERENTMKKTNTRLEEKLGKYSAMGAAFLLTAPLAQANVQFTNVNPDQSYGINGSVNIDLNGDAIPDVRIRQANNSSVFASPLNGAALAAQNGISFVYPYALPYGANIGAGLQFGAVGTASVATALNSYSIWGNWTGGNVDAYLGVRFNVGPNTHYGYIHLEVVNDANFILKDYAWEDTPNTPILAGAQASPIPTMNQWGTFLYGLILFILLTVFGYNQKKEKDAKQKPLEG
jgi:hypothetical protein